MHSNVGINDKVKKDKDNIILISKASSHAHL